MHAHGPCASCRTALPWGCLPAPGALSCQATAGPEPGPSQACLSAPARAPHRIRPGCKQGLPRRQRQEEHLEEGSHPQQSLHHPPVGWQLTFTLSNFAYTLQHREDWGAQGQLCSSFTSTSCSMVAFSASTDMHTCLALPELASAACPVTVLFSPETPAQLRAVGLHRLPSALPHSQLCNHPAKMGNPLTDRIRHLSVGPPCMRAGSNSIQAQACC